ncbi:hypothetical protein JB92DRAFT_2935200 [Gautieria morchelliformis]|nr:hypothetical protein JB92DRAFT_2935200 [Gautieria morchelliformis]
MHDSRILPDKSSTQTDGFGAVGEISINTPLVSQCLTWFSARGIPTSHYSARRPGSNTAVGPSALTCPLQGQNCRPPSLLEPVICLGIRRNVDKEAIRPRLHLVDIPIYFFANNACSSSSGPACSTCPLAGKIYVPIPCHKEQTSSPSPGPKLDGMLPPPSADLPWRQSVGERLTSNASCRWKIDGPDSGGHPVGSQPRPKCLDSVRHVVEPLVRISTYVIFECNRVGRA